MDAMPAVHEVLPRVGASLGAAIEGVATAWPSYNAPSPVLPELNVLQGGATRWIELFNRGAAAYDFTVKADQSWVTLSAAAGRVTDATVRLEIGVDWAKAPAGRSEAVITINGGSAGRWAVRSPAHRPTEEMRGFVEVDRHIAIDAPHVDRFVSRG
jgi:hypothetical protein